MTSKQLNTILDSRQTKPTAPRSKFTSMLIPLGLLLGFIVLLLIILGDRLLPARELAIETVVTLRADAKTQTTAKQATGANPYSAPMLFQASGWIEPDPLPTKASALIDGVIESVEVLEGERVQKGQLLAVLIDDDTRLDLQTAESRLDVLEAKTQAHLSTIEMAKAEIETLNKQIAAAKAKKAESVDIAKRYKSLPTGSVPESDVAQAQLKLSTQKAEVQALAASRSELDANLNMHKSLHLEFLAKIEEAKTEVARRQLALDRTRVLSPIDGIILRLLAMPGQKRMLGMDSPNSAVIAILYEADKLQARIDVPLEEAAKLTIGQSVRIRSNFMPDKIFHGTVSRIVGEADLQRNTLQAKVRIENPDIKLRPEMLCRAEFLALATASGKGSAAIQRVRVFAPESSLIEVNGNSAKVWMIDESGNHLIKGAVTLGAEQRNNHRLISKGLKSGARVVINPPENLKTGERVKPLKK